MCLPCRHERKSGMKNIDVMKCRLVKESEIPYGPIRTPGDASGVFRAMGLADAADEIFAIACLANNGAVTGVHEVSHGDLGMCIVHPREVFKRALLNNASGIILAHNHPSGSLEPSEEDRATTQRMKAAGELLGIAVEDHIILSSAGYYSFKDGGIL